MIVMPGAWRCERHRLWTNSDCPDCDLDLIAAHEERQDEDMSAPLTTRDALASALAEALHGLRFGAVPPESVDPYAREDAAHIADALLASGALADATKLAEDEALVERVAGGEAGFGPLCHSEPDHNHPECETDVRYVLRALVAALSAQSERAEVER